MIQLDAALKPAPRPRSARLPETLAPGAGVIKATIESWPYALVDHADHEA